MCYMYWPNSQKSVFFFGAKYDDSYDIYLKNGLIQNCLFQRRFLFKSLVKITFTSYFKKIYLKDDFHVFFKFKKNLVKSRHL